MGSAFDRYELFSLIMKNELKFLNLPRLGPRPSAPGVRSRLGIRQQDEDYHEDDDDEAHVKVRTLI